MHFDHTSEEDEEDYRQERETGGAGSEESWDEREDEEKNMLPEAPCSQIVRRIQALSRTKVECYPATFKGRQHITTMRQRSN